MVNFWADNNSNLSSIFSSPLVSSIVTLYALILLYVPYQFMRIVFSPVLILTGVLLLTLLRLGAIQRFEDENKKDPKTNLKAEREDHEENKIKENSKASEDSIEAEEPITGSQDEDLNWVDSKSETESETETSFDPNPCFEESFVRWNLRAPLEVIYEEYEDEDEDENEDKEENRALGIERYQTTWSRYYPDSDSENSSEGEFAVTEFWDSPENMRFRWEEEDRDGLIEIALDNDHDHNKRGLDSFHVEEDNLIEIDISLTRNDESPVRNDDGSPPPPACQIQLTGN